MTNSQLFTQAHKLAKTFEGDYSACFVLALKEIREMKNELKADRTVVNGTFNEDDTVTFTTTTIKYFGTGTADYEKTGSKAQVTTAPLLVDTVEEQILFFENLLGIKIEDCFID